MLILWLLLGLVLLVAGGEALVRGAVAPAARLGLSPLMIGLTVVAVGTSLPERVAADVAPIRRHGDLAFGNMLGSSIYNAMGILGVTALIRRIPVPPSIAGFDIRVMLAATGLPVMVAISGWRVTLDEGAALPGAQAACLGWLAYGA